LLNEIDKEIKKRKEFSIDLSEKDKVLRTNLLRNTEMKSALQNLADIAGYKLNSIKKKKIYSDLNGNLLNENLTHVLLNKLNSENSFNSGNLIANVKNKYFKNNSVSYTSYIEMAYNEVKSNLIEDKQTLIVIIRNLKTNEGKLKDLEKLNKKVNSSLTKLKDYTLNLINILNRDKQIEKTLRQLISQIRLNYDANINNIISNKFMSETNSMRIKTDNQNQIKLHKL
jgi:hypothetical protein